MANEKQKVYVRGQWLSVKDVSIKYEKHLTLTLSEIIWIRKGDSEKVLVKKDALVLIIYP